MSSDWRPIGIRTLVANEENSMAGLRAIRTGAGMTYAFKRNGASESAALGAVDTATAVVGGAIADGTEDTFVATLTVPPAADAHNSAASLIVVNVDGAEKVLTTDYTTDGAGSITFEVGAVPGAGAVIRMFWRQLNDKFAHDGAGDTLSVWVDGVEQTVTTDYVVSGSNVIFEPAAIPTVGQVVNFNVLTANAVVIAGGVLFFDTHQQNLPVWNHIIPTTGAVVEIM